MLKNDVKEFSIYRTEGSKVIHTAFKYDELKPNFSFRAKSPHGILNPEGKVEEWSGRTVRELFTKAGVKPDESKTEVVIIGTDGYLAQMEMGDFFTPDAMLATHVNQSRITPSKGGPQLFFPNLDKTLPKDLLFEGWGVWYVSSFVVGSLPPSITLELPSGKTKSVAIDFKSPQSRTTPKYYPPGHFRTTFETKPVTSSTHNLKEWLKKEAKEPFTKLKALTYYGGTVPISNDLAEYDLVVAWDGKLIAPKFGGPVQICPQGKVSQCTFLVKTLVLEK